MLLLLSSGLDRDCFVLSGMSMYWKIKKSESKKVHFWIKWPSSLLKLLLWTFYENAKTMWFQKSWTQNPVNRWSSIEKLKILHEFNKAYKRFRVYNNIFGINFDKFLILNWILKVGIYAQRGEVRKARYVSEKAKHVATIGILIGTLTVVYMFVQKVKFFQQVRVKGRAFYWA